MNNWFSNINHLIFILIILIFIIIAQGIFIFRILREKRKKEYGEGNIAKRVERYRDFWGEFVIYVLSTSIVGLFIASLVKEESITLSDMNSWVSIVLGLVALIVGIISLWLGFYNVDQMTKSQEVIEKKVNEINKKRGWQQENGKWYFIDINGNMVRKEWRRSGDRYFYLGKDGYVVKDEIINKDGYLYYVDDIDGGMVINTFVKFEDGKRYFGSNGKAIMTGKHVIDGITYTFENGYVVSEEKNE